jgi:LysW-gamma-L-lysine carboxypeptidase
MVKVDRGDCATLIGLVERYSPTGREGAAVEWLVGRMRELGFTRAFVDEAGNAVGVMGEGGRQLVLLGHIDTVPGEIPVRLEGEVLRGRGAVDAKGALAAMVDAAAAVGPRPGWEIVVVGAVDEEGDSRGARHLVDRYRPAAVIVGEPSRWDRVTLGYKGSVWAEATLRRPVAHPASPAESACEAAAAYWQAVRRRAEERNEGRGRVFDQVSPNLLGWDSGDDGFEGWARLRMGTRLPAGVTPEVWLTDLRGLEPAAEVRANGAATPAYLGEKNSPLSRAFLHAIRSQGGTPSFVLKSGTADLNIVAPAWGCPALAYGPGDSSLDHTAEDRMELAEYRMATRVLAEVLGRLAGG